MVIAWATPFLQLFLCWSTPRCAECPIFDPVNKPIGVAKQQQSQQSSRMDEYDYLEAQLDGGALPPPPPLVPENGKPEKVEKREDSKSRSRRSRSRSRDRKEKRKSRSRSRERRRDDKDRRDRDGRDRRDDREREKERERRSRDRSRSRGRKDEREVRCVWWGLPHAWKGGGLHGRTFRQVQLCCTQA